MMEITKATPMKERPLFAALISKVQYEAELRALCAALGLVWGRIPRRPLWPS